MSEVAGKVVVITGASSGLGEATAKMLAEKGAKLVLGARREERLKQLVDDIKNSGGEAIYKTVDVTKRSEVEALANAARDEFGRIDVLVNNAGLMPLAPLDELKVDEWDQMIDVNIKGVMYGVGAVLPKAHNTTHKTQVCYSILSSSSPWPSDSPTRQLCRPKRRVLLKKN